MPGGAGLIPSVITITQHRVINYCRQQIGLHWLHCFRICPLTVCMYVCIMYVCMYYVCMYVCMYACMRVYFFILQVCKAILQKLLEFLEAGSSSSVADRMEEVLCWIVLLLRDVWPSMSVVLDEAASIESALSIVSSVHPHSASSVISG